MDRCLLRAREVFRHPGVDCGCSPFGGDGGSGTSPRRAAFFARTVVLACDVTVSHHAASFPFLSAVGHGIALRAWVCRLERTKKATEGVNFSCILMSWLFYLTEVFNSSSVWMCVWYWRNEMYLWIGVRGAGGGGGWRVTGAVRGDACRLLKIYFICQSSNIRPFLLQNPERQ